MPTFPDINSASSVKNCSPPNNGNSSLPNSQPSSGNSSTPQMMDNNGSSPPTILQLPSVASPFGTHAMSPTELMAAIVGQLNVGAPLPGGGHCPIPHPPHVPSTQAHLHFQPHHPMVPQFVQQPQFASGPRPEQIYLNNFLNNLIVQRNQQQQQCHS